MFRGKARKMDCRDEAIAYHSPPSSLTGLVGGRVPPAPESGTQTVRVCRTLHGPVEARAGGIAYARRYAVWGRELETLVGLDALNRAGNIREVDAAVRKVSWNENVIAADGSGNIGYWHPGLFPLRPQGLGRASALSGNRRGRVAGPVAADADPRRHQPAAGLAGQLEQPAVGRMDFGRRDGAQAHRRRVLPRRAPVPAGAGARAQADLRAGCRT